MIDVNDIRDGFTAVLLADAEFVGPDYLGGEHVYAAAQAALDTDKLTQWVTISIVTHSGEDPETTYAEHRVQFDVYALSAEVAEKISRRIMQLVAWSYNNPVAAPVFTYRRVAEPVYEQPIPPEQVDDMGNGAFEHRMREVLLATYAKSA